MLTIRRTNLNHRTRNGYTRASQTDEQRKVQNEVERNRNPEHKNFAINPYRAAFNYNVEIDYSSQQIVAIGPMNIAANIAWHLSLKMKLMDCVARVIK